jgi:hypothetical protein
VGLYLLVGVLVCYDLFVSELPSADALVQQYDVQHHLNAIRAFADGQRISSRGVSFFLSEADAAIRPYGRPSLYPSAWYAQCALLVSALDISVPVAINASLAATMGVALPLGMCVLMYLCFERMRPAVIFGSVTCLAFVVFPWCMLVFGPLYPNLVAFALMPASIALCLRAFRSGPHLAQWVRGWLLAVVALFGQAFLHPNTLFSMFVILVPYAVGGIYRLCLERGMRRRRSVLAAAGFALVCLGFWYACYRSPVFRSAVGELWPYYAYNFQAIVNILTQIYTLFFFGEFSAQVLLATFVIIGFVRCVYEPKTRWLAIAYLLACLIVFINATTSIDPLKRFVAGFWYTDAVRVSTNAVVVAALLAAAGLGWTFSEACRLLMLHNHRLGRRTHPWIAVVVIGSVFFAVNFMPSFNWPGAHSDLTNHIMEYRILGREYQTNTFRSTFGDFRSSIRGTYSTHRPLDVHELSFLRQVRDEVGDELVVNDPTDGSTLAYGAYGIRTYYRNARGADGESETEESRTIRTSLADVSKSGEVREALEAVGARYVLQLDGTYSSASFLDLRRDLDPEAFAGISSITPDTPGFTKVLSSGTCHLYRIDAMDGKDA